MPTKPSGFVSSFEYAGELNLNFGGDGVGGGGGGGGGGTPDIQEGSRDGKEDVVDGYIRHLHLNNGTGEKEGQVARATPYRGRTRGFFWPK